MKSSARVVVIGGGIVGCSVLYHLAKMGWNDVALIERMELTSGSSWHAAGGLFTITRPNTAAEIHRYSFQVYSELEKESGQSCGFHSTGGMNICRTQDEIDSNAMMQSACRRLGIESHFIGLDEARAKVPFLNTKKIKAVLWEEEGGHVDPASATQAFAAAARQLGAEIYRHTPVIETNQRPDGTWDVVCEQGTIHADYIVNAAGLWGREVAALAGIQLPLVPVEHHYMVTETLPEIEALAFELPQINDNETGMYARQEGLGLLLGAYEKTCTHWALDGTPQNFGHELLENDLARLEWNLEKAFEIMPCLTEAGIKRVINGPMIFSPDLGPLIGPHPDLNHYFCANGVMAGFNQGAGIGKVLAEWIIDGETEMDVSCWDVARFGTWAGKSYTEKRTRYFYENRSEKVYPYQEFEVGRPIHKPAVYDRLKEAGAVFGSSFGQEHANWFVRDESPRQDSMTYRQPNWWQPVIEEGKQIRDSVGLMEFSAMAKFMVSGSGADNWLNRVMANRLPAIGRMALSPMLSPKGRIAGDFSIARLDQDRFMLLGSDTMQLAFMRLFKSSLPDSSVQIENLSQTLAGLHLCGPDAKAIMSRLAGHDMDNQHFPFMSAKEMNIGSINNVIVMRVSFTGESGYEMYLPAQQQHELFDLIWREGLNVGIKLVGTRALMHTRLEKSFPAWGLELSLDYTAVEGDMERFVKPDKGEFIGRSAFLSADSPREKQVTFTVDAGNCVIWGDEAIFLDNEPAGYVTSGGFGPVVERHIALGYLDANKAFSGGDYTIEILGKQRLAELQTSVLYDPDGKRMRE
ncbi:MAG: dimethylglycine dehydrogenase [Gammaproteobacteria bacterium]|jgi:dimethylglycine dehydrogenase